MTQGYWISPKLIEPVEDPSKRFLYGLNLVRNQRDETVRRGAVVKAIAVFSRYHFIEVSILYIVLTSLHLTSFQ